MKIRLIFTGMIAMVLWRAANPVLAQSKQERAQSFHAQLGEIIEAQENIRYNIFGTIPGFSAARLYAGHELNREMNFVLHILRNDSAHAQVMLLVLAPEAHRQLLAKIDARIQAVEPGEALPAQPVYPIPDNSWKERGILKRIVLRDGSVLNAALLRAQTDTLFVQTPGGIQAAIPDIQIDKVGDLPGEIVADEFYRRDPNNTRLLLAPTGHGLKAGQAYFADYFLFFPTLAVGLTDYLALSGGVSLVPGLSSQLAYFGPKLSLPVSAHAFFSTGLLYIVVPEDTKDATLTYAVGTFGSARSSLTLGLGLPFVADEDTHPVLLFGGEVQVSSGTKLLTENWLFTGDDNPLLFSGGVRFFGEKLAVDVALVSSDELIRNEGFPFVPWVDFSVFFGK